MFSRSVNVLTEKEEYYYKREQRRDYKKSDRLEQHTVIIIAFNLLQIITN